MSDAMRALLGYSYAEFVDAAICGSNGEKLLFLVCNEPDIKLPSTEERSTVKYISQVGKSEVVQVSNVRQLVVYLAQLETESRNVPKLFVWNSVQYQTDLILSKLLRFDTTLGEQTTFPQVKLSKWCTTIEVKEQC